MFQIERNLLWIIEFEILGKMFKRGVEYTRKEIARIVRPDSPPKGGNWDTLYPRIGDKVFIFLNIGVPGRSGHDFENHFDARTRTLVWFSKPNGRSTQPHIQKIVNGSLTPYFFARWGQKSAFIFLGTGSIIDFADDSCSKQGHKCVRFVTSVADIQYIIPPQHGSVPPPDVTPKAEERSSFLLEKHLEDFIVTNWTRTPLARDYEVLQRNGEIVGRQFRTDTGPIDILSQRRDKTDFLVVELKRDLASDVVVGQTLRYMGWVKEHLCSQQQDVTGCIIAQKKDAKLNYALRKANDIQFMRYEVDFRLIKS